MTTTSRSRVSCTSSSTMGAPTAAARRNAASVFSGQVPLAPRWAMMSGAMLPGLRRRTRVGQTRLPDRVDRRGAKAESVTVPATTQPSPAAWVALRVDLPAELEEPVASFLLDAGASGLVTEAEVAGRRCVEAP